MKNLLAPLSPSSSLSAVAWRVNRQCYVPGASEVFTFYAREQTGCTIGLRELPASRNKRELLLTVLMQKLLELKYVQGSPMVTPRTPHPPKKKYNEQLPG